MRNTGVCQGRQGPRCSGAEGMFSTLRVEAKGAVTGPAPENISFTCGLSALMVYQYELRSCGLGTGVNEVRARAVVGLFFDNDVRDSLCGRGGGAEGQQR